MNKLTVLRYGTQVQLAGVDMNGFWGRDNHPELTDVGFLGVVVGNHVDVYDQDGDPVESKQNVLGGTEYADMMGDEIPGCSLHNATVCYVVRSADGRVLDLMNHEIEVI